MSLVRAPVRMVRSMSVIDLFLLLGICCVIYALVGVAQSWMSPYHPTTEISLTFPALARYSVFSLVRVVGAYSLSLLFTLTYGYWAAKSKRAEPILISLLDILQSVPILSFMPGLILALVRIFPHSNLGLEIATIVTVFTCEGWNMVFSFYSSVKTVPQELKDVAHLFKLRKRDLFWRVEVPFSMNGLLWNSMLSMAGGWFYIMVAESIRLGDKDYRLPGIGSYMAEAYAQNDSRAIIAGMLVMAFMIIVADRCIWAPLVAWSDRFRYDRETPNPHARSLVLEWLRRSKLLSSYSSLLSRLHRWWVKNRSNLAARIAPPQLLDDRLTGGLWFLIRWSFILFAVGAVLLGLRSMYVLMGQTTITGFGGYLRDTFYTLIRVFAAVLVGSLWTIPLGVFIGTHPVWARRLQPVVQVVASFPAPMFFPLMTYALVKSGVTMEITAIVLMLFASQWYILFNVISGAILIPQHLMDVGAMFRVRGIHYWKALILPAIFPSLVNGWITAAGGAWNSCIVSEFVSYGSNTFMAHGIGASLNQATQQADFATLAGGSVTMITVVVLLNRFFWGSLYRLAETKFRME